MLVLTTTSQHPTGLIIKIHLTITMSPYHSKDDGMPLTSSIEATARYIDHVT